MSFTFKYGYKVYCCTLMCGHYKWCTFCHFTLLWLKKNFWFLENSIISSILNSSYPRKKKLTRKRLWNIFTRNLNKYTVIVVFGWLLSKFCICQMYLKSNCVRVAAFFRNFQSCENFESNSGHSTLTGRTFFITWCFS